MNSDFPQALKLVLVDEGGLDDDPHDHGGRTAHGITQREYDAWRKLKGETVEDVWKISPDDLSTIYHDSYWEPRCDQLPAGLDYAYFDFCVNAGAAQANRTLQRSLGVRADGVFGPITAQAIAAKNNNIPALIHEFMDRRRSFYRNLAQFSRYGRGWLARCDHVEHAANQLAHGAMDVSRSGLSDDLKKQATARAVPENPALPPVSANTATITGTIAVIGAGVSDKLNQLSGTISTMTTFMPKLNYVLLAIAVISTVFGIYAVIHSNRIKEAI